MVRVTQAPAKKEGPRMRVRCIPTEALTAVTGGERSIVGWPAPWPETKPKETHGTGPTVSVSSPVMMTSSTNHK